MMFRIPLLSFHRPLVAAAGIVSLLAIGLHPGDGAVHAEELTPPIDAGTRLVEFDLPNTSSLPTDIVAGADGTVWVSLLGERNVLHLDRNGVVLATIPVSGPVTKMTTDHEGGVWGVQLTANYVVHLTVDHRALERRIPTPNSFPADIWDGGDQVYFTESGTGQLGRLTESTWGVDEWPVPGAESLSSLSGSDDHVLIADSSAIWVMERSGTLVRECHVAGATEVALVRSTASHVTVAMQTRAKIMDVTCDLSTGNAGSEILVTGRDELVGFASSPNRTWYADAATDSLGWDNPRQNGSVHLPSARRDLTGLALTEGRFVWTLEKRAGKLARLDSLASISSYRLHGADRYETAVAISNEWTSASTVFLVSGEKFADALSAGPIAGWNNAPLLLTARDTLPVVVENRLRALEPSRVVIVGGPATVSATVIGRIQLALPKASVERIDGVDRYAVSRALLTSVYAPAASKVIYVADGRNYPDALSASAAAGHGGAGILLVDGSQSALSAGERDLMRRYSGSGKTVKIVGGPVSVSAAIEADIGRDAIVRRLGGPDRYSVSRTINEDAFGEFGQALVANGGSFSDALAGGTYGAAFGTPLFLVQPTCVPEATLSKFASSGMDRVILSGGPLTLGEQVASLNTCG